MLLALNSQLVSYSYPNCANSVVRRQFSLQQGGGGGGMGGSGPWTINGLTYNAGVANLQVGLLWEADCGGCGSGLPL